MKKALLFLGMAVFGVAAQAQDFKPTKGDVTTEFGLTGGINETNFKLNDGAALLRFRYFNTESVAYRLGFNVSAIDRKNYVFGTGDNDGKRGEYTTKATQVLINLGIEKHFTGTDRLSPYVGADLLFGLSTNKVKGTNLGSNGNDYIYVQHSHFEIKDPGIVSFGLRGVVGADYYIAKRLYLGVEAGLGFSFEKEGTGTSRSNVGTQYTSNTEFKGDSNFSMEPSVITGVRVGFAF